MRQEEVPRRTEVDDIKHFRTLVLRNTRKQLPVRASRYTDDRIHMRAIMLDEFDAHVLFLPQFEMAIDRGRNDEVRAVFVLRRMGKKGRRNYKPILASQKSRAENRTYGRTV